MVRVRIAPSPTGLAHLGTAYTALFNYAFAKKNRGKFILRLEDTDRTRYVADSEKVIYESLKWLSLKYDEGPDIGGSFGPYVQSQRLAIYQKYAHQLVEDGKAYYCFCSKERLKQLRTPMYDGLCRKVDFQAAKIRVKKGEKFVIRLKVPKEGKTGFKDEIRGQISVENKLIDDQVLLKSDGYPTYHLGVVIDDYLMKITHVIRAEEWLSSTPKHVLLYRAFGWPLPKFIHLPLLRNPDHSKISKRKNNVSLVWYKQEGYLPEAIVNYLALLGWSHPEEKEIFSLSEFIQKFDIKRIHPVGPVFDLKKLDWLNGIYIRQTEDQKLVQLIKPHLADTIGDIKLNKIMPLLKERISKLAEASELTRFIVKMPEYDKSLFKGSNVKDELTAVIDYLKKLSNWIAKEIYPIIKKVYDAGKFNKKEYYSNLYLAVEGQSSGLPLFESMEILGKNEVLLRLNKALKKLI